MFSDKIVFRQPKTECPVGKGVNVGSVEMFKGNRFNSFIREEIQNTLDVVDEEDNNGVALVELNLFLVPTKNVPCYQDMRREIRENKDYWKQTTTSKSTAEVFKQLEVMNEDQIWCLRYSDFNNTGLSRQSVNGRTPTYDALIHNDGLSDKHSGAGGSFGLGKNAPYALSDAQCIIYSTVNKEGEAFSIGVAKHPSYNCGENHYDGTSFICAEEGYFEPVKPIRLDKSYNRKNRKGMDKYILGYNGSKSTEELAKSIIAAVFNNFYMAILDKKLVVKFKDVTISHETIDKLITELDIGEEYIDKNSYNQYLTIKNPDIVIELSLEEENDVTLYFRESAEGAKRVGVVRKTGMKILDKTHFPSGLGFDGVAYLRGRKVNDFFQQFENPEHNGWRQDDIKKIPDGKKKHDALFEPFRNIINEKLNESCSGEIDAEGVSDFLPNVYTEFRNKKPKNNTILERETLSGEIERIVPPKKKNSTRKKTEPAFIVVDENGDTVADLTETAEEYAPHSDRENTTRGRGRTEGGVIEENENGELKIRETDTSTPNSFFTCKQCKMEPISAKMRYQNDTYEILLTTFRDIEAGYLSVKISGETSSRPAKIYTAMVDGKHAELNNACDKIKLYGLRANIPSLIGIKLDTTDKLALEVYLYENSK